MNTVLSVNHVSNRFGGVITADDITFDVGRGEIVGLIGPNGAGKTTLINIISGFHRAQSGTITLDGSNITNLTPGHIASSGLSRTFQSARLLQGMSLLDDVKCSAYRQGTTKFSGSIFRTRKVRREEEKMHQIALDLIERVGLSELAYAPVESLTAGQHRLASVARALAMQPKIVLFDEPAAGLGEHEAMTLAHLLLQIRPSLESMIVVDHHMSFVRAICSRLLVLSQGQLIASGSTEDVIIMPEVIRAYMGEGADHD